MTTLTSEPKIKYNLPPIVKQYDPGPSIDEQRKALGLSKKTFEKIDLLEDRLNVLLMCGYQK